MSELKTPFRKRHKLRLSLAVDSGRKASKIADSLAKHVTFVDLDEADVLVALGGDGFMLHEIRKMAVRKKPLPIYGINAGSVGFLLNHAHAHDDGAHDGIEKRIINSVAVELHPLSVRVWHDGKQYSDSFAFNELSLFRHSQQAAHLGIMIDGKMRLEKMICDGLVVATPAGSTAYNSACNGAILPLGAEILALTPISVFRPRRWRGAILSNSAVIHLNVQNPKKRPVAAAVDGEYLGTVKEVEVREDRSRCLSLLFDPGESLDERIFKEQFMT